MDGPMDGLRVLEVANFLAAPSAAALMADMGADVVKVEPPEGDAYRGRRRPGDNPRVNVRFELDNRGKRSISVALGHPKAREVVLALAARTDVFVTNLVPARLERYGLTFEAVRAVKPDIVYAVLTGYGATGLDANRTAYDSNAFWARSGAMGLAGQVGTPPVQTRPGQGDHPSALNLLAATLAALRLRDGTGEAQFVDVSLLRTGVWSIACDLEEALNNAEWQPDRQDRETHWLPTRNAYETRDGRVVQLTMPRPERYWAAFCRALERPEWTDDERYSTATALQRHGREILEEIEAIFRSRDLDEWTDRLDAEGLIWAPMALLSEVVRDAQLREGGAFERVERADGLAYELVAAPFRIPGAGIRVRGPAPAAGGDTDEVLREAGVSVEEIAALRAAGVFGDDEAGER